MRVMYIKPTRFKHSSGFRTFECGYITEMSRDNRVVSKEVITNGSDHVYNGYGHLIGEPGVGISLDLTMDGYIRIRGDGSSQLEWPCIPMSSMEIRNGKEKEI